MNHKSSILGFILVIIGGLFLLDNLSLFHFNFDFFSIGSFFATFWPLFILIPGFLFHLSYFSGKTRDAGILVPGGILLVVGATCQFSMLFSAWSYMWPGFILAVAFGLLELYIFGDRNKALLIPISILSCLSLIFFITFFPGFRLFGLNLKSLIVPALLIFIGVRFLTKETAANKAF